MKKVAIVQKALAQYRVEFQNQLREELKKEGVELTLIYSKYQNADSLKKDEADIDWAVCVPSKIIKLGPVELLWQSCSQLVKNKDLVIVEQANKNLLNYLLILRRFKSKQKLAYWGHGINRQINKGDIRNKFKQAFQNQCDWWFAYTEKVKEYLIQNSFPREKITAVQNAIDTRSLIELYQQVTNEDVSQKKRELNISSENIGIYCGGIYAEKRIPFLLEACEKIRAVIPDFHIIFIGAGPDANLISEAVQNHNWMHYVGPKFGLDKVKYFKASKVFLMPGLVGLAILDSFALQTPIITTDYPFHSPEIEYLENEVNGLITQNEVSDYKDEVIKVLEDQTLRNKLIEGCKASASKYTIDKMVQNFVQGILNCLS